MQVGLRKSSFLSSFGNSSENVLVSVAGKIFLWDKKNGRYKKIEGDKKAWELKTCISKYPQLNQSVVASWVKL